MAAAHGNSARTGRAKASPSTEPASPLKVVTDPECAPNLDHLRVMLNQLNGDICDKIDLLSCELRLDISSVREELRHAIEPMQQKLSSHDQAITELQRVCTDHSDLLTSLDSTVSTLKAEVKLLTDKCEDLEGRARRNNIRLVSVPEGAEGVRPTEFIAQLLMDTLGLDELPPLDRAHRTLRTKPSEGKPPRPFVICLHFFHVRNDLYVGPARLPRTLLFSTKAKDCSSFLTILRRLQRNVLHLQTLNICYIRVMEWSLDWGFPRLWGSLFPVELHTPLGTQPLQWTLSRWR